MKKSKSKSKLKTVLIVFGVIIVLASVANMKNQDNKSITDNTTSNTTTNTSSDDGEIVEETEVESIEVSVEVLLEDYLENEISANKKYEDKLLIVTGVVDSINEILGTYNVHLDTGGEFEIHTVACYFSKDKLDTLANIEKGSPITIVGTCKGFNQISVKLEDCDIIYINK